MQSKKIVSALLCVLMIAVVMPLFDMTAYAETNGTHGDLTWTLSDDGVLTISGEGEMKNYLSDSPSSGYPTVPWYANKDMIKSVVIEDGITNVGSYTFYMYPNLETVELPDTVTVIGKKAFYNCASIAEIDLSLVKNVGEYAFHCCSKLESVDLSSVEAIEQYAFYSCDEKLAEAKIGESCTFIGDYAFKNCASLSNVNIPNAEIGKYAFTQCTALETVTLSEDLEVISEHLFDNCGALKAVTIPESVKIIGAGSFKNCASLETAVLGSNLEEIKTGAFSGCKSLKEIVLPDSVTRIGGSAFYKCEKLERIEMNEGVSYIGEYAFSGCKKLKDVVLPESITTIKKAVFHECYAINSVTIPKTVTTIENYAFPTAGLKTVYYLGTQEEFDAVEVGGGLYVGNHTFFAADKHYGHTADYELSDWKCSDTNHWKECPCGVQYENGKHKYSDWKVTKEPTTTEPGRRERVCAGCGDIIWEELPIRYGDDYVPDVIRLSGKSRCETAVAISKSTYLNAENVVLAAGDEFADALAGAPLAYALNAPILLIRNNTLDDATRNEIERLGAKNVYILGGTIAIGTEVSVELEDAGLNVMRISGTTRFDTAVEIAKKLMAITGKPAEVFFASSRNYPDALAVSGIAAVKECPILYLAPNGELHDATAAFLKSCGASKATILGGVIAIDASAEDNIKSAKTSLNVNRIAGKSRYDTCLLINEAYEQTMTGDCICVATGANFPDALAGGVFAAQNKAPMMLVGAELNEAQVNFCEHRDPGEYYIFGGTGAVSEKVAGQLK